MRTRAQKPRTTVGTILAKPYAEAGERAGSARHIQFAEPDMARPGSRPLAYAARRPEGQGRDH